MNDQNYLEERISIDTWKLKQTSQLNLSAEYYIPQNLMFL